MLNSHRLKRAALPVGIRYFVAIFSILLISACADSGSSSEPATQATMPVNVELVSSQSGQEKATSENLLNLNQAWSTWTGQDSGIRYNADAQTLTIPPANNDDPMVIGVQRFELALTEGAPYTLTVAASSPDVAALLFLYDSTGAIVPLAGEQSGFSSARPNTPLTFNAPADIAGFYLQVQNAWQATRAADLSAQLTTETVDPGNEGSELINPDGLWTNWAGEPNGVSYLSEQQAIQIQPPLAGEGNRYGVRRFDQPLTAGQRYQLRSLDASRPGAATLLFLFDAVGSLVPFVDAATGNQVSWVSASDGEANIFEAPDGVAGFAIQVQSGWQEFDTTSLLPSLRALDDGQTCDEPTLESVGQSTTLVTLDSPSPIREYTVSDDGRYAAFISAELELIAGEVNANSERRAYWQDLNTGTVQSIVPWTSTLTGNHAETTISGNGRYIYFRTTNSVAIDGLANLSTWDIFRFDRETDSIDRVTPEMADTTVGPITAVSADGSRVLFSGNRAVLIGDTNVNEQRLIEYDVTTESMELVQLPEQTNLIQYSASSDLRYLAFDGLIGDSRIFNEQGQMTGLRNAHTYLLDRQSGLATEIADTGYSLTQLLPASSPPQTSSDGAYVVFRSNTNLLSEGGLVTPHIYRWTRATDITERISTHYGGAGNSGFPAISADGQVVVTRDIQFSPGFPARSFHSIHDLRTAVRETVSTTGNLVSPAVLSKDGKRLLYAGRQLDGRELLVKTDLEFACQ